MKNPLTNRVLTRLFPSPFGSCRFGSHSDVVENSITVTRNPPELRPFESPLSSISTVEAHSFKTKPGSSAASNNGEKVVSELKSSNFSANTEGRRCHLKPLSPLMNSNGKKERAKQSAIVKHSSSSNSGWFSSEEEEAGEVDGGSGKLFSLSSGSSDSSPHRKTPNSRRRISRRMSCELGPSPFEPSATSTNGNSFRSESGKINPKASRKAGKTRRRTRPGSSKNFSFSEIRESIEESASSTGYFYASSECSHRKTAECRRRSSGRRSCELRGDPLVVGGRTSRVGGSYAVVKASNDPHRDFKESMVEMIVEKGIYGAEDLQKLVQLFLSLNSSYHHSIILEVFSEICEALLNN